MSEYGLEVLNDDFNIILNENCTMCCILGWLDSVYGPTGIYVPDGFSYYVHMNQGVGFSLSDVDSHAGWWGLGVDGAFDIKSRLDENRQVIIEPGKHSWGNANFANQCIIVGYPINGASGNVGISFSGKNNFFSITDASLCAPVVFKGDIVIDSKTGWDVSFIHPDLTFINTLMFVYSEDPNVSVGYCRVDLSEDVSVRRIFAFGTDGYQLKTNYRVKAVLFSNRISPQMGNYGLQINDVNGKSVYNSSTGFLQNPTLHSFGAYKMRQFVGVPSVRRPMFAPYAVGAFVDFDDWAGEEKHIGFACNGFELALTYTCAFYNKWTVSSKMSFIADLPVMILDAENYFKF